MNILKCIYPKLPGKSVLLEALFTEEEIENNKHLQYLVESIDLSNLAEHTLILNMSLYNEHKGENAVQKALTRLAIKNDWNYVKYILLNDETLTFEEQLSWITTAINEAEENQKIIYADKLLTFILPDSHLLLNPISSKLPIIKLLIENKANINILNKHNENLLHLICRDRSLHKVEPSLTLEMIKYLIENKINLNAQSCRINQYPNIIDTTLQYAVDNTRMSFTYIKYLIEQNAQLRVNNPNDKNEQLNELCTLSDNRNTSSSYIETIKYLIENNADINNKIDELEFDQIKTPLPISLAAQNNNAALLKLLYFLGATIPNDVCEQLQEQCINPGTKTQTLLNCLEKNEPEIYKHIPQNFNLYPTKLQTSLKYLLLSEKAFFKQKLPNLKMPKPIKNIIMENLVELETDQARQAQSNSR